MNMLEELHNIDETTRKAFLALGKRAAYTAGQWLPTSDDGFSGIRLIVHGSVTVFALHEGKQVPVYHYGTGESLGVRALLRPDAESRLSWQADTELHCLEFEGASVLELLQSETGSDLRSILEHAAHLRDLDILIALHPLFRTLPMEQRHELFEHAHPLALAPGQAFSPAAGGSALHFITDGALIAPSGGIRRPAGKIIYGNAVDSWQADGWTELLSFDAQIIADTRNQFPEFAAALNR